MTPRTDIVFLDIDDSLEENMATIHNYKYTRYPVCDGSPDRIVGFVHIKDLYGLSTDTPMRDWKIRELPAVPETMGIARLIDVLQDERTEICLVVDEHGGTAGIVTLTDIMEQIVGRIDDEYRHDAEDKVIELPDGTMVIDGGMPTDELVELLGFAPEDSERVETAAGLMLMLMDRIPKEGDTVRIEHETATRAMEATFTVVAMDRLRVDKIAVEASETPKE